MPPQSREYFEANEPERVAFAIAHGAFSAVRALESQATFGIDIHESEAQAHSIRTPRAPSEIDDALAYLRERRVSRQNTFTAAGAGPSPVASTDSQGEQQIGYDVAAWEAGQQAAALNGVATLGEEDEYRGDDENGAALRGRRISYLLENNLPLAIVDPLDGSNQAAGMGQRSGWASCAMVKLPNFEIATAVLLGDGRGFVSSNGQVWLSESSHPDRTPVAYLLEPRRNLGGFARGHFVIPAAKRSTVARAQAIMMADDGIQWISPLGGNPGILAAMLGAGALAAMQPTAYAWDHMAPLILANVGFPVIQQEGDEPIDSAALGELLLKDMVEGRKTSTIYVGRTLDLARRLRDADLSQSRAGASADWRNDPSLELELEFELGTESSEND